MENHQTDMATEVPQKPNDTDSSKKKPVEKVAEIGGFAGPEPTRFGDWEKNGRCVDF